MFGYLQVDKAELKVREWDAYKSVYCGLCKQMGKDYSFLCEQIGNDIGLLNKRILLIGAGSLGSYVAFELVIGTGTVKCI